MVFPIVIYVCESRTRKKAECKELILSNGGVEDSWESLGLHRNQCSQSWRKSTFILICTGRTDAEAEVPIFWPLDVKSWLTGEDSDTGKDWRKEKGVAEDEMVGWHHWLNGHKSEQTLGDSEGQGSLACCTLWGRKESDMTEGWNNNF